MASAFTVANRATYSETAISGKQNKVDEVDKEDKVDEVDVTMLGDTTVVEGSPTLPWPMPA